MSELVARAFLRALFHAGQSLLRHAPESPAVDDAVSMLHRAADVLTSGQAEAVITVGEEAFYLGTQLLPHASIEFHGMHRDLRQRGVDSITVLRGVSRRDLADLAGVVAGHGSDLPVGGTVRLNERPLTPADLERRPLSGLRRTYAASLDALRAVSSGRRLELGRVAEAVEGFLRGGAAEGGPSLMLATLHNHDETAFYHSVNVCLLSLALGRTVGLGSDELRRLGMGALLMDVGRVVLDDPALRMPGRLSNEDWALVRLHPQEGALAILAATGPGEEIAAQIALEHHVRFDGGGYPDLGGRRPHLFSRLVAVADAYGAITSHRPHRPARSPQEARHILMQGAGEAFDPDLVAAFNQMLGPYPPGSVLRLESGRVVVVTSATGGGRGAMAVCDDAGAVLDVPEPVDLARQRVAEVLAPDDVSVPPAALVEAAEASIPIPG
jgi:HD-GYP domain-containing protein (c-di-GMP phosphodiesterase class II)